MSIYLKELTKVVLFISKQIPISEDTSHPDGDQSKEVPSVIPRDYVNIKVHRRNWKDPKFEGPFEVTFATPTAVKIRGRSVWYLLSQCKLKAKDQLLQYKETFI